MIGLASITRLFEQYLAKYNTEYEDVIYSRALTMKTLPQEIYDELFVINPDFILKRYEMGLDIDLTRPNVKAAFVKFNIYSHISHHTNGGNPYTEDFHCFGPTLQKTHFIHGGNSIDGTGEEAYFAIDRDAIRKRFMNGHPIPDWAQDPVNEYEYRIERYRIERYRNGYNVPEDKLHIMKDEDHIAHFAAGGKLHGGTPTWQDKLAHYRHGGDEMPNLAVDPDETIARFMGGYTVAPELIANFDRRQSRVIDGYDVESRPYLMSHLLGFDVPATRKIVTCAEYERVRADFTLSKICMLVLDRAKFAFPRKYLADVKYVTNLEPAADLTLVTPDGEVVFRADPNDEVVTHLKIDEICDKFCSPEWGEWRVGDLCGIVILSPHL